MPSSKAPPGHHDKPKLRHGPPGTKAVTAAFPLGELPYAGPCLSQMDEGPGLLNMNDTALKNTLIGEEWMALRQIALGAKAAAIPRSVRTRLEALDLISRDDYGQLVLTEKGHRLIATAN